MFLLPYLNQVSFAWSLKIINTSVLGSIILLGTLIIIHLAKRSSAGYRFLLIFLALNSFLILPVMSDFILVIPANSVRALVNGQKIFNQETTSQNIIKPQIHLKNNNSKETAFTFWISLFLIWLLGVMFVGLRVCCGILGMYRLLRRADHHESVAIDYRQSLTIRIVIHPKLSMPVTCGLFSPRVLLPENSRDWPTEQRQAVLYHEAAHIKRRDNLTNLLAQIIVAIYWFNPLVWLSMNQLRINREKACDDWVLYTKIKPSTYANILLEAVRANNRSHSSKQNSMALYFNSKGEERLKHVLNSTVNHRILQTKTKTLMLLFAVILFIPISTFQLLAADDSTPIADNSYQEILPQISLNGKTVAVKLFFGDKCTQLLTRSATEVPIGWPEKGVRNKINSSYGYRIHPILKKRRLHSGIDINSGLRTPIVATADGKVIKAGFMASYGNTIVIEHPDFTTLYAQLNEIKVKVGDDIKQGKLIGYSGKSGINTGPHLHYEIQYKANPLDPQPFLDASLKK
jgi:murein DD-endopeptidase MepM/ murein hydrolase activator NlpD